MMRIKTISAAMSDGHASTCRSKAATSIRSARTAARSSSRSATIAIRQRSPSTTASSDGADDIEALGLTPTEVTGSAPREAGGPHDLPAALILADGAQTRLEVLEQEGEPGRTAPAARR